MPPLLILALCVVVPVLAALLLRVNALYVFLSVAAGLLLTQYLGDDTNLALGVLVRGPQTPTIANILALYLPLVLTLVFLRKSVPKNAMVFHVVPIILTGMMLGVLVLPLLDSNMQAQIFQDYYGGKFKSAQDLIVGASVLSTISLMWATGKPRLGKHAKHHK